MTFSILSTSSSVKILFRPRVLSYAVEMSGLVPANHFGARKRRSTEQALLILQEQIYKAWRARKVLTLTSFDVKGAIQRSLQGQAAPETWGNRHPRIPGQVDWCLLLGAHGDHDGKRVHITTARPATSGPPARITALSDTVPLLQRGPCTAQNRCKRRIGRVRRRLHGLG